MECVSIGTGKPLRCNRARVKRPARPTKILHFLSAEDESLNASLFLAAFNLGAKYSNQPHHHRGLLFHILLSQFYKNKLKQPRLEIRWNFHLINTYFELDFHFFFKTNSLVMRPILPINTNTQIVNGLEVRRPADLSDGAWRIVQNSGLLTAGDGSIWDAPDGYFDQFSARDLPIVLRHWGHKFETISLNRYPGNLPSLDFSDCIYMRNLYLNDVTSIPAMTGLGECNELLTVSVENVRIIEPHALDSLPDCLTIWCANSGLFRSGGQQSGAINSDELTRFLAERPAVIVYGLLPENGEPDRNLKALIDNNVLQLDSYGLSIQSDR